MNERGYILRNRIMVNLGYLKETQEKYGYLLH
jgi:hypothetical protein